MKLVSNNKIEKTERERRIILRERGKNQNIIYSFTVLKYLGLLVILGPNGCQETGKPRTAFISLTGLLVSISVNNYRQPATAHPGYSGPHFIERSVIHIPS